LAASVQAVAVVGSGSSFLSTVKVATARVDPAVRSTPMEAAPNTARRKKARVLALPAHITLGAAVLNISPSPYWKGESLHRPAIGVSYKGSIPPIWAKRIPQMSDLFLVQMS
jgi:hypothetical protein